MMEIDLSRESGVSASAVKFLNISPMQAQGDICTAVGDLLANLKPRFVGRDNQGAV